ncbi:MAG: TIGR03745 family integrating conjugative element membrane protein [Moritella sp.]|uniref:TIGR03745 family integrating conjugative element membrane protein n=1 Tax=Moritella sp. TaxID=78556 RepID=UPI001DFB2FF7|nr:TIGR03745 family integrating conjugative element membrane protein [Moritella sp.]NQZ49366.1 TIGR03745 family integrating conjugative element membrane protein [Moritella sp.]
MNKLITKLSGKILTVCITASIGTQSVLASGIPPVTAPSGGNGGGLIKTAQNYMGDGILLLGLLLSTWSLIRVVSNGITTYGEISDGKATYKDLGTTAVVGVVLASATFWMVTLATEIF